MGGGYNKQGIPQLEFDPKEEKDFESEGEDGEAEMEDEILCPICNENPVDNEEEVCEECEFNGKERQ